MHFILLIRKPRCPPPTRKFKSGLFLRKTFFLLKRRHSDITDVTSKDAVLSPGSNDAFTDPLAQWFLTRGASIDFKRGARPYALCNMESSIK